MTDEQDTLRALLRSLSTEEFEKLPKPSPDEIREALARGRNERRDATEAVRPSAPTTPPVSYK